MSDVSPPTNYRGWEYAKKGDYHRNLDPNWSYTPTYLRKVRFVEDFVNALPRSTRILDVGCGEGVLVERFHERGWNIAGVDANYASDLVRLGDASNLPHEDQSFDLVMLLDVLEHIGFGEQSQALSEISRVLRPGGYFLMSVPNLAHFNSRVRLFFKGNLDRTDAETDHIGERPIWEHEALLEKCGFSILDCVGLTFSLPYIYRQIICKNPARFRWLHDALEPCAAIFPALAMFDVFVCRKKTRGYPTAAATKLRGTLRRIGNQLGSSITLLEAEGAALLRLSSISDRNAVVLVTGAMQGARSHWIATAVEAGTRVYVTDISSNVKMLRASHDTESFEAAKADDRQWIVSKAGSNEEFTPQSVESIDVLIIGREPSYEAVRADLQQWLPKLKDGGTVVFYDFAWAEGVQRAVRELVVPYQVGGGRWVDSIYSTRIRKTTHNEPSSKLLTTVIIPTYGRPDYLKDAIESVQRQNLGAESYEICVVDNSPKGEAKKVVEEMNECGRHEVRYVREPRTGLHNARHAGARAAQGEILVYIDDDVIAPSSWLEAVVKPFRDPRVACVAGKTVPKWEAKPPEWLNQFSPGYLSLLDLGDSMQELQWPEGAYGCNMTIRRSVLYELGGFNPDGMGDRRLIWYRGDGETGLHKKMYDAGYKVIYVPEAWLYHRMPATRLQVKSFYWRAFIQGISDSYSHAREYPSRYRMIRHGARCFINAALTYWKSIQGGNRPVFDRANASYWYGRAQHQLRVAMNRKLYDHVLTDTYFLE